MPLTAEVQPSGTDSRDMLTLSPPSNVTLVPSAISGGATGASFIWFISFI